MLSKHLLRLRKEHGLTQPEVAQFFCDNGLPLTNKAISKWELGYSKPDAEQFLLLCKLYSVRDVLHEFCGLPAAYDFAKLNVRGRERVTEYISLLANDRTFKRQEPARSATRLMPLYELPVSAGTGQFLDNDAYELMEADESVPLSATFAVRVSGNSMEPRFDDGQIIYVQQRQSLDNGEIGIFMLNGDGYCKKLQNGNLVSLNEKYPPIRLREFDDFRIVGRVVG